MVEQMLSDAGLELWSEFVTEYKVSSQEYRLEGRKLMLTERWDEDFEAYCDYSYEYRS